MDITISSKKPTKVANSCVVVAVGTGALKNTAKVLDKSSNGMIKRAMKRGDIGGVVGQTLLLQEVPGSNVDRVLLVGVDRYEKLSAKDFRKASQAMAAAILDCGAENAAIQLPLDVKPAEHDEGWMVQTIAQSLLDAHYQFTSHPRQDPAKAHSIKKITIAVDKDTTAVKNSLQRGRGIGAGMSLAKDLGNLAPNICTPRYLSKQARALAKQYKSLSTKVLGDAELAKLGMESFLAVSKGSVEPAQLICMEYKGGAAKDKPVVLVGKGVTFDTGGISIKPSASMDEMKYDMCGAASVFGAMKAICEMKLKRNVIGVVAAAENMPDGNATRPGDVLKTMSGQSIEILNTDAEGRMVLCDTLTYVNRYKPKAVIDVATLTGACIVALGHVSSAVMANDDALRDALYEAGQQSGDVTWPLPLWDDYQQQLDSNFADMANIGGSPAGSITAGCFLSRFAKDYSWAHLDIAGVAWTSGKNKGATGRPVPLLLQYLCDQA